MDIKSTIRVIEDYPIEGISFKDITTLLKDKEAFNESLNMLEAELKDIDFDYIVGIESRGFIFGAPLADRLGVGFVPVRKPGKLPGEIEKVSYELEYGNNELEMHKDALNPGDRVVIIDDLIATGGSAKAAARLIETLGAEVAAFEFLIELEDLDGREILKDYNVISLVKYDHWNKPSFDGFSKFHRENLKYLNLYIKYLKNLINILEYIFRDSIVKLRSEMVKNN